MKWWSKSIAAIESSQLMYFWDFLLSTGFTFTFQRPIYWRFEKDEMYFRNFGLKRQ